MVTDVETKESLTTIRSHVEWIIIHIGMIASEFKRLGPEYNRELRVFSLVHNQVIGLHEKLSKEVMVEK